MSASLIATSWPPDKSSRWSTLRRTEGCFPTISYSLRVYVQIFSGEGCIPKIGESTGVYYYFIPLIYADASSIKMGGKSVKGETMDWTDKNTKMFIELIYDRVKKGEMQSSTFKMKILEK